MESGNSDYPLWHTPGSPRSQIDSTSIAYAVQFSGSSIEGLDSRTAVAGVSLATDAWAHWTKQA